VQSLDRIVGAARPIAAVRRHHRANAQLIAAHQRRQYTSRRLPLRLAVHRSRPGGVRRRANGWASPPAQIASRSARSTCLNRLRPVRPEAERLPAPPLAPASPSAVAKGPLWPKGLSATGVAAATPGAATPEPEGFLISRTRTAGGEKRASSSAGAWRHDSRTTRFTVLRRTAERSTRFGTLMINRGTLLGPFRSTTRAAGASSRTACRRRLSGVNRSVSSKNRPRTRTVARRPGASRVRLRAACGPSPDASGSQPGRHESSGGPGNRACACAAGPRVDRCAS
jgi:hypothetical protein